MFPCVKWRYHQIHCIAVKVKKDIEHQAFSTVPVIF